jgi:glycerol-3-phosphate cytidylyltransferase
LLYAKTNTNRIVYTGGTFDLFHYGHVNFLKRCAEYGEVVVALNTDAFIQEFKKITPSDKYSKRLFNLQNCRYVTKVVQNFGGQDSKPAIELVSPNLIAIGSDWLKKDYLSQMSLTEEWLNEREIALLYLPYTWSISSTMLRKQAELSEILRHANV